MISGALGNAVEIIGCDGSRYGLALMLNRARFSPLVLPLALLAAACGSSSSHSSATTNTTPTTLATTTSLAASSPSSTAPAATGGGSFCADVAAAKPKILTWTTATPGSPDAAAEPLAAAYGAIAAEAPAQVKAAASDLAATFVKLEKYDKVTDPNTLLQESPLTNGHITPDGNAIAAYASAHC